MTDHPCDDGPLTAKKLARILYEEFERDTWGDIDPQLFELVVNGIPDDPDDDIDEDLEQDVERLEEVLVRVIQRLTADK